MSGYDSLPDVLPWQVHSTGILHLPSALTESEQAQATPYLVNDEYILMERGDAQFKINVDSTFSKRDKEKILQLIQFFQEKQKRSFPFDTITHQNSEGSMESKSEMPEKTLVLPKSWGLNGNQFEAMRMQHIDQNVARYDRVDVLLARFEKMQQMLDSSYVRQTLALLRDVSGLEMVIDQIMPGQTHASLKQFILGLGEEGELESEGIYIGEGNGELCIAMFVKDPSTSKDDSFLIYRMARDAKNELILWWDVQTKDDRSKRKGVPQRMARGLRQLAAKYGAKTEWHQTTSWGRYVSARRGAQTALASTIETFTTLLKDFMTEHEINTDDFYLEYKNGRHSDFSWGALNTLEDFAALHCGNQKFETGEGELRLGKALFFLPGTPDELYYKHSIKSPA